MKKKIIGIFVGLLLLSITLTSVVGTTETTNEYYKRLIRLKGWVFNPEIKGENVKAHAILLAFLITNETEWIGGGFFYPKVVTFKNGILLGLGRIRYVITRYHGSLEVTS